jgi:hypothetical protein
MNEDTEEDCGSRRGRFRGDINVQVSVEEGRGGVWHPLGLQQIYREARDYINCIATASN